MHGLGDTAWSVIAGGVVRWLGITGFPLSGWSGYHLASWSRFDHLGDPTEVWTAETGLSHVARDEAGWTTEWSVDDTFVGDPAFECTHSDKKRLHHDARGRLLEVYQGLHDEGPSQLTRTGGYSYDAMGRVLTFTDGEGNTYRYAYDGAGRLQRRPRRRHRRAHRRRRPRRQRRGW